MQGDSIFCASESWTTGATSVIAAEYFRHFAPDYQVGQAEPASNHHHCPLRTFVSIKFLASMGSYSDKTNLLEYLRSKSQVDCDSLDTDRKLVMSIIYLLRLRSFCAVLTKLCQN